MGDVIGGIVERVVREVFKVYEHNVVGRLGIVKEIQSALNCV